MAPEHTYPIAPLREIKPCLISKQGLLNVTVIKTKLKREILLCWVAALRSLQLRSSILLLLATLEMLPTASE